MSRKPTARELEEQADKLLHEFALREFCPECDSLADEPAYVDVPQGIYREDTGQQLVLRFKHWECSSCGHEWEDGEGRRRGNEGDSQILDHAALANRKKREIYNKNGKPDPSFVSGLYWRQHPHGRKINADPKVQGYYKT